MKKLLLVPVLLLAFACKNEKAKEEATVKKPNILLIVVDDQGYADFEPFDNSSEDITTPNMSRIANAGMVFTQAYTTAPVCSPSRAALITGKNQFRWDKPASWGPGLPDSVKTLPEYLKEVGYATSRIGKNDLGQKFHRNDVREYPLNHGYDEFLGFSAHAHDYWLNSKEIKDRTPDPYGTSALLGPLMHNMGEKSYDEGYLTDIFTDEAIDFIKRKKDEPFFLTLAYNSVHHLIHQVPQKYLDKYNVKPIPNYDPDSLLAYGKHEAGTYSAYYDKYSRLGAIQDEDLRKYYLANLNCLDDNIGRVLDVLESENLDKNTIIVFVSDNGGTPLNGANNAPLTAGKYSIWEGGIRVPMAMSWPGKIDGGKVENEYVSALDIMPTLLDASGVQLNDNTIDGINLLKPEKDRLLVWKWQKTWAVRKGDWKLTNTNENHWKSRPSNLYIKPIADDLALKLFDLKNDPGERVNLAEKYPEKVAALETAYKDWMEQNFGKF
ncbi:sulfatase-like hydrolase/transferase [Aureibaculum sp. 2210JD6-5]|uniref:sulfatase family protein n=1 Tax=Aureibaculum sp. 2210JD6-5 TaxID=3103957 RepID=UPI002AADC616|nr:sulfatase-like hydrolase/transferase [Aureibaculum sp. 2210JD6-5]MDY7395614.1 sulfatase-like hydrolase/transferase [Aureibaculum sp. 2210JD6-5]